MALSIGVEVDIETRRLSGRVKTVKTFGTLLSSHSAKAGTLVSVAVDQFVRGGLTLTASPVRKFPDMGLRHRVLSGDLQP